MTIKKFSVLSSDGVSVYTVVIEWDGENLYSACDCKAGSLGDWCRHKGGVLNGEEAILAANENLTDVLEWVKVSPVHAAILGIRDAENQQKEAEMLLKRAKVNVLAAKKTVANLLNQNRK